MMTEKDKPMSLGASIWHIVKFFIFVGLAIFFAYYLYDIIVLQPERDKEAEREYQAEMDVIDARERRYCLTNPTYAFLLAL
jgi:hypothetical protein